MLIHDVKPTALAIHDGKAWRDLGNPATFDRALVALETLALAGMENAPARLGFIVWRDDRRLKTENRKQQATRKGTVAELIEQAKAGAKLERLKPRRKATPATAKGHALPLAA
jgi:hypothetical protein